LNQAIALRWIWKADRDFLLASQLTEDFSELQDAKKFCEVAKALVMARIS
jgi:hypothetical protein